MFSSNWIRLNCNFKIKRVLMFKLKLKISQIKKFYFIKPLYCKILTTKSPNIELNILNKRPVKVLSNQYQNRTQNIKNIIRKWKTFWNCIFFWYKKAIIINVFQILYIKRFKLPNINDLILWIKQESVLLLSNQSLENDICRIYDREKDKKIQYILK